MKVPFTKISITFSRVHQIQDLGQSKYKLRLFSKRTHGISKIIFIQGFYESLASLEIKMGSCPFMGVHNCEKTVCSATSLFCTLRFLAKLNTPTLKCTQKIISKYLCSTGIIWRNSFFENKNLSTIAKPVSEGQGRWNPVSVDCGTRRQM